MIIGNGIDIVEIERIRAVSKRQPKFYKRILVAKEQEQYLKLSSQRAVEFLAGRFAAKEAYAKARGTGIGESVSFQDIHIKKHQSGQPYLTVNDDIANTRLHLTISHSKQFAVAQVIIENLSSPS
ncbi:holo-ACP synthase [Geomicrobium sp. JSM 1781026]|uniref:holo-ACP synthase n=1 Tax=Geomicrobium sp. JSM 1781026 TaxID=3344580 RepID=UPI0035BF7EB7